MVQKDIGMKTSVMEVTPLQHTLSTIALCACALTNSYLLISVFPYSGFMAIELIPSGNEENAGSYAGLIASAFMIGRAITSYSWSKAADVYGRITVLYASLVLSFVFSVMFGLAGSFASVLIWRFMLGLGNGIMGTAKTAVSELAGSKKELETWGMSLVLGMWGWGFLISPVIAGALAEPVKQYPNACCLQEGVLGYFLTRKPFFLPNMVGALICLISIVCVKLFVTETLPVAKCRSAKHIPRDMWAAFRGVNMSTNDSTREEKRPILPPIPSSGHRDSYAVIEHEDSVVLPSHMMTLFLEHDIEDAIRDSKMRFDEQVAMLATSTAKDHNSIARSIIKRTRVAPFAHRVSAASEVTPEQPATISSLWADKTTREHLFLFWAFSSLTLAVDESFPLFCISKSGGLGLSENSIGTILSASGLIYATTQYVVYSFFIQRFGLYGSMRIGALLGSPIMALVPISLYLNRGQLRDALTWSAFEFLSILMAVYRTFGLAFFSSIIVATNRTVSPSHLGTLNGLAGLGGSVANGIGPTFAGVLVAFSLSSGAFTPEFGAIFMFLVLGILGSLGTVAVYFLLHDPDKEEDYVEMKS